MHYNQYKRLSVIIFIICVISPIILKIAVLCNYCIQSKYYAEVLCNNKNQSDSKCKGRCQLFKDLKNIEDENSKPELPNSLKEKLEFYLSFYKIIVYEVSYTYPIKIIKQFIAYHEFILCNGINVDVNTPP
jgi:hypothetical protein